MSTGFTFGAGNTPAFGQSAFGAQPQGSITFGTPVSSAIGTTGFGQPAASGFGSTSFSSFGTPQQQQNPLAQSIVGTSTAPTGFNFGTPATSSTGFGFGATAPPTAPGFGFGQQAQPTGFGFGTTQQPASTAATGFGFAAAAPVSTTPGFGFGTATGTGTAALTTGLAFGAVAPTTTSVGFGTPIQAAAPAVQPFNLGLSSTPAVSTGFGFNTPATTAGVGLGFGGATSTAGGGLFVTQPNTSIGGLFAPTTSNTVGGFSLAPTTTTTPSLGLGFGTTTTTIPTLSFGTVPTTTTTGLGTSGFGFGLGGATTTLSAPKTTTTTSSQSVGLGGIVQTAPKSGTTVGKTEVLPRDEPLPNEIQQTVESFKSFVKQQKGYSSDVARCSVKEFKKVATEIEMVSNLLNEVEKQLQMNRAVSEKLKLDTARGLKCVEMAQRTFDTPAGLQYENTAPLEYFMNLANTFEREMHSLKMQIETTDKYVKNLGKPSALNSDDLAMGMRRLHESFVALAGRLQSVHTQVQTQKDQYLNLRKYMLNDDTNVFEKSTTQAQEIFSVPVNSVSYKPPAVACGPTPFNTLMHPSIIQAAANQAQMQQPTGLPTQMPQPSLFGGVTTQNISSNLFGSTTLNATFGQQQQPSLFNSSATNFQLQKPPTGNKRSK